ncbi:MAG: RNA polymerase sigma factor [Solirubrobacteraceae bacterium]
MEASALQAPARLTGISLSAPLLRLRSDEQLVALFRAGSEEAFRVMHDRYRQRLFAYVRQMLSGSRQDAEDALQDVFIRAHAALLASDKPISLRAWLYRVAHNRCIDQLRRPQVVIPLEGVELTPSSLPDPLAEAERREDLRRLIADVRRLPAQQRSMLLMRELEGASYSDLADAHGVTVAAVKSLLVRARIGLVRAAEARDIACVEIRSDLVSAHERGVRATGRARRHLKDCSSCQEYKTSLRATQRELASFTPPSGPLSLLAKLFGLGAGGSGAAAGSSAAAGGGAAASGGVVAGGGAVAATACKVAAVVCSTLVAAGGAVEVNSKLKERAGGRDGRDAAAMTVPAAKRTPSTSAAAAPAIELPRRRGASTDQRSAPATERGKSEEAKKKAKGGKAPVAPAPAGDVDFPYGIGEDPGSEPDPLVEQGAPGTVGADGKVILGDSGDRAEDPDALGKETGAPPSTDPTTAPLQQQTSFTDVGGSGSSSTQPPDSTSASSGSSSGSS